MTKDCLLARAGYAAFGLLAVVEFLVVQLVSREGALLLLSVLLALQILLVWASQRVSALLHHHHQLKRAYEDELRSSRESESLNDVSHGLTLIDGDGRISYVNRACQSIIGYSEQEIVGRRVSDFGVFDESFVNELLHKETDSWYIKLRCADGHLANVVVRGRPYWHHGRIVGNLATIMPLDPAPQRALN